MENFQLYRTNLLLGGQVKWDIVLENDKNDMYIKDFNLSPISNNIPYTYKYNENILNNSHRDNLKSLYKTIESSFYNEGLDDKFNNNWPDIVNYGEYTNVYSNIYDMGCKRTKNYNRYNRQFEFFCPLWLEHVEESITFKITINNIVESNGEFTKSFISSRTINILEKNNYNKHNKFVDYIKEHFNYIGITEGNNKVIKINFNDTSYVSGIDVKNGIKTTKDISHVVSNMITRERPVLETDNMIMNCFVNNNMICNQLFNFNLCFNVDTIINSAITKLLKGKKINISIDVIIDGIELEKRDFYCNYDFIPKEKCYDVTKTMSDIKLDEYKTKYPDIFSEINVLDYLHDNECIDFINKNKYCPKICHWSLADNPSYLFNIYRGFDGYSITTNITNGQEELILVENEHQYGSAPNTLVLDYSLSHNNTGWINIDEINYWSKFNDYIIDTETMKKNAIHLNGQKYINGLKYGYVPYSGENKYLIGLKTTFNVFESIINTYNDDISWLVDNKLVLYVKDDLIMLITYDLNYLTFARVLKSLNKYISNNTENSYIKDVFNMMKSVITPKIITLNSKLLWDYVKGPTKEVKEVSYIKDDSYDYVIRYDGNIKPYFIKDNDIIYYKDYISDNRENGNSKLQNSIYIKYACTGFEPNYPSINYHACKKIESYNRDSLPYITVSEHIQSNTDKTETLKEIPLINTLEYSWFNNGISIVVLPEHKFNYTKRKTDTKYINEIVNELISNYYNISGELLNHVLGLYNLKIDWEYLPNEDNTNIDDYLYTFELKLK